VVLTAGAWSGELAERAGMRLPVRPQRGQIARAWLPEHADPPRLPVASGFGSHYLLQDRDGQIVFGATQDDDAGFAHAMTVGGVAELVAEATRAAPGLARAHWRGAKAGFRPTTPDGAPLLGRTRQCSRLVVGTGFGSIGLTIGAFAGAQLAALALGEQVDIPGEFDPDRFANHDRYRAERTAPALSGPR
jgi:D-amino-acid dehydrogenase